MERKGVAKKAKPKGVARLLRQSAKEGGCTCKKSACLRLHCKCFSAGGCCTPDCRCANCLNDAAHEPVRKFVKEKTKIISPWAFEDKIVGGEGAARVHAFGCSCKKGCRSNYCECLKNGVKCSNICKCCDCANGTTELERQSVRKIHRRPARRKHQLSFREGESGEVTIRFAPVSRG